MALYPSRIGTYAQRPAAGNAGKRYVATDSAFGDWVDDGSGIWRPNIMGVLGYEPPAIGTFTTLNSPTTTNLNGGILIAQSSPGGTQTTKGLEVAVSAPYTLTIFTVPNFLITQGTGLTNAASVFIRDSGGGTATILDWGAVDSGGSILVVAHWNGTTTNTHTDVFNSGASGGSNNDPLRGCQGLWLRIKDDNANQTFSYSRDGTNFDQLFQESRTAFLPSGGNRVGIGCRAFNMAASVAFYSWQLTSP